MAGIRYDMKCAGDFFKVQLKFKMAATDQLQFFVGAKTQKIVRNHSHFTITLPTLNQCWANLL